MLACTAPSSEGYGLPIILKTGLWTKNIQDCSRRMRTPVGADHNKESQKYAGVGGSTQLDFINITIPSNRVMSYVYICIR